MVGVDEVGRGSWAGPLLVVAARAFDNLPKGLTDSKLMTKQQRESIFERLTSSVEFGEGWVSAVEIDAEGLAQALKLGVSRALGALKTDFRENVLLDGKVNYAPAEYAKTTCRVNADLDYPIVSAASIYAKVVRDTFMQELAKLYPDYGFEHHVGYGTKLHRNALREFGVLTGVHRLTFKPIRVLSKTNL